VRVIDYKAGYLDVPPPEKNWQMKTLGLYASRVFSADEVTVEVWKLRDDGQWTKLRHTFDAFDIDAIAAEERDRLWKLDAVRKGRIALQLVEGDHCATQYCPSLTFCPAKKELAQSMAMVAYGTGSPAIFTPEEQGIAWDMISRAQVVIDRVRASLEDIAAVTPIPLPDGRTLALTEETREYVVGAVVRDVVTERYGAEIAAKVCETKVSSSKAAISRELGKEAKGIMEEIRRRGGAKVSRSTRLKAG
jgi:hypothetical protein